MITREKDFQVAKLIYKGSWKGQAFKPEDNVIHR